MKTSIKFTDKQIQKLKDLKMRSPRMGVQPTKIVPDKTKYSRKTKHKKST